MTTRSRHLLFPSTMFLLVLLTLGSAAVAQAPGDALWADVDESFLKSGSERDITPKAYRTLALDKGLLADVLATAPLESRVGLKGGEAVLSLPLPEGGFSRFRIVESPIMAPELAAKYPEIKTYRGQGIDDPAATARFDLTPAGFHAMILSPGGSVFIDPYSREDTDHYMSYRRRDSLRRGEAFKCHVESHRHALDLKRLLPAKAVSGSTLRTYRLAVAATGEYTAFHGGTVAQGQAAIVTAMNRVNGIYERDVAIRMTLIAGNDQLVYTNSGTDPYSNNNGSTMLGQNQSNIDSVIGSANYDIGHVFSTGGGGVASLRVPCVGGSKARGVTGQSSPTGDPFWVDYVAHEMGHQWGGNHTFNGNAGNCSGGNRNGSTAYEPGSGTTIQAYAGICGAQNIQNNSDDHFHGISLDEMISYSTTGNGNNCPVATATGNNPPTVDAGAAYTIPINTPFELCGSATDPDSDPLTYGWEEFDLGAAGAPNSPSGNAPIFRSFSPVTSPCRTFPQLSDLVNNTQTIGELLPSYSRTMNFRLTARDNRSGGGGVGDDSTTVTVSDVGGPFQVTAPNTAVTWPVGTSQNVTWNVAGTDLSPISCSSVDISLSTDGGTTYSVTLVSGAANSGSASITVPAAPTSEARVKVQCAGNIFFDISNTDFTIDGTSGSPPSVTITAPADGSSSEIGQSVSFSGSATDPEDGSLSGSLSWTSSIDGAIGNGASFSTTSLSLGSHTITASVTDSGGLSGSDMISISVTPVGGGNGPQNAVYDSGLGAPACAIAGSSCDSLALVDGVANAGPEPNQPNTLDGCADGTSGSYHSDESNDRIVVSTLDGADFAPGATVRIDATVWAWTTPSSDTLDLFYAADANSPSWVLIDSIVATVAGEQTLSAQYTLPAGSLQAVRAQFRYQSTNAPCSSGNYNDRDDLVFAVGTASPICTIDADCDDGAFCNGAETCNTGTGQCESGTAPACDDGLYCNGTETCNEGTDSCDAGTAPVCDDGLFCNGAETCNEGTDSCDAGTDPCSGSQTCNETTDTCEGGGGAQDAVYDAGLGAPACTTVGSECDSVALLDGRAGLGPEANQPNTLDGCADGTSGSYHSDESNDRIVVRTLDGSNFAAGATVEVEATVWAWSTGSSDTLDLFYAADANNPSWVLITSLTPPAGGAQTLSAQYTLPTGTLQAVRAQFRYQSTNAACSSGAYNDRDDLVFAVDSAPPSGGCSTDEDFEGGATGWTTSGTCSTGTFVLGTPTQQTSTVVTQVGGDHTSGSGSALFTATNSTAGNADVDGGECAVTSPVYNVTDASDLSIWYFHGQRDAGDDASGDYFVLEASVNGGAYAPFVSIGDVRNVAAWTNATTTVPASSTVQLRVRVSDGAGPGDIVEGGIDDLSICAP